LGVRAKLTKSHEKRKRREKGEDEEIFLLSQAADLRQALNKN